MKIITQKVAAEAKIKLNVTPKLLYSGKKRRIVKSIKLNWINFLSIKIRMELIEKALAPPYGSDH